MARAVGVSGTQQVDGSTPSPPNSSYDFRWEQGVSLETMEMRIIITVYKHYRYNKTQTAKALGLSLRGLRNKLTVYRRQGHFYG